MRRSNFGRLPTFSLRWTRLWIYHMRHEVSIHHLTEVHESDPLFCLSRRFFSARALYLKIEWRNREFQLRVGSLGALTYFFEALKAEFLDVTNSCTVVESTWVLLYGNNLAFDAPKTQPTNTRCYSWYYLRNNTNAIIQLTSDKCDNYRLILQVLHFSFNGWYG